MKLRTSSFIKNQRGAIVVELALVVPLLTILFLGTVQFGLVLREHQIIQNAAREGARFSSQQQPSQAAIKNLVILYLQQENIAVNAGDITVDRNYFLGDDIGSCGSRVTVTHSSPSIIGSGLWGDFTYTAEAVFRNLSAGPC